MSLAIILHPRVITKLKEASVYLENARVGYGNVFLDELDKSLKHISNYPLAQQLVRTHFRRYMIGRFKYMLIYTVHNDSINVTNLVHAEAHPKKRFMK